LVNRDLLEEAGLAAEDLPAVLRRVGKRSSKEEIGEA
jgi:hypothetical protein